MTYRCAWDGRMPCLWPEQCGAEERCGRYGKTADPRCDCPYHNPAKWPEVIGPIADASGRSDVSSEYD